jgi:hypothetical protein
MKTDYETKGTKAILESLYFEKNKQVPKNPKSKI